MDGPWAAVAALRALAAALDSPGYESFMTGVETALGRRRVGMALCAAERDPEPSFLLPVVVDWAGVCAGRRTDMVLKAEVAAELP